MAAYAKAFDARALDARQAAQVVRLSAQIEASAAAVKALATARIAETKSWQENGYRSAADQLADQAGMSPSSAKRALETGQRMADQPEVAEAALSGQLSLEQATAVSDGVAADPSKAEELIETARSGSMSELNEAVAKVKAGTTNQEERRRARHAKRSLRKWTDRDGALGGHLYGHPEDGALLWRALDPIRRRLNALRHQAGQPNDTFEALDYDALMILAALAVGRPAELTVKDVLGLGLFPQIHTVVRPDRSTSSTSSTGTSPPTPYGTAAPNGTSPPNPYGSAAPNGTSPPAPDGTAPPAGTSPLPSDGTAPLFPPPDPPPGAPPGAPPDGGEPLPDGSAAPDPPEGGRAKKMAGSPVQIMIRTDLDVFFRGAPIDGELCEIAGYGPVPLSVVEDLIATENPFIIGILTKGQQVVGVYHHGRRPNAYQRSALDFLQPTCAAAGCNARTGLQYDHRADWAKTKITAFDLLDRLCPHHHARKTRDNWALVDGRGKRPFVPPDDPRHPRHQGQSTVDARQAGGPAP